MKTTPLLNQLHVSDVDVVRIAQWTIFSMQAMFQNESQIGEMDHSENEF